MRRRVELNEEKDSFNKIKEDINKRKRFERKVKRRKVYRMVFKLSMVFLVFLILYKYDNSEISRVQSIVIKGNDLVTSNDIKEISKLETDDRLALTIKSLIEKRLAKSPFIQSAKVEMYRKNQTVMIHVLEEEPIAYEVSDQVYIYFKNGEKMPIAEENIHGIEGLILISNIDDDEFKKEIVLQLGALSEGSSLAISEVINKGEKHDKDALMLVMNHGYYVFSSVETLPLLDNYATIISGSNPENKCIHLLEYGPTEDTQVATVKPCEVESIENDEEE